MHAPTHLSPHIFHLLLTYNLHALVILGASLPTDLCSSIQHALTMLASSVVGLVCIHHFSGQRRHQAERGGGGGCSMIHERFPVVPGPISDFIAEVKDTLHYITNCGLTWNEKYAYMRETRHAFGRTALVLSGGGALGAFHIVRTTIPSVSHRIIYPNAQA